ncbi:hypothetical protein SAMN05660909_02487 [Chitinophaga terrae (ex Kim and Jung 2007)]|uniref:Uncharacterized protein n=1 Tax=Chitinophaga terrae (ex Kim and Jung 2007) TaxID=408074 RepID=A0A1H4C6D3_9BACT|nr:hypothetical protein [Chitinophaga terrae (ex Kim and Jung 2007)]GEP92252.1 hypothetical protein CTE07_38970 [Chitinophaga terrae (ex Kim and Jung 2007)]SEA55880.1 hypothetical protein SAMN05660909_02487 [Chitinophaga terrae (ex Kim and Jung 2007)]
MRVAFVLFFVLMSNLSLFGQDSLKKGYIIYECEDSVGDAVIINPDTRSMFKGGGTALWMYVKKNVVVPSDVMFSSRTIILNAGVSIDSMGRVAKVEATDWETDEWRQLGENVVKALKRMPVWVPRTSFDKSKHYKDYRVIVIIVHNGKLSMKFDSKIYH